MKQEIEQISMDGIGNPSAQSVKEECICRIQEALDAVIHDATYKKRIHVENPQAYIAVKAHHYLVAKVFVQKSVFKIEIDAKYASLFTGVQLEYSSKQDFVRIRVKDIEDVCAFAYQYGEIAIDLLASLGDEGFGCCSRYIECSDAKHCTHPDKLVAMACAYRKNLEDGKIFYGKNKNI